MHALQKMVRDRVRNKGMGVYSACTASHIVIEAVFEQALEDNRLACIEATANQVNQFGGYTGMRPRDFAAMANNIARKIGFPAENIIFGGDHLGPLTWRGCEPEEALRNAEVLVSDYVKAGFNKIHIDTSMALRGDKSGNKPDDELIARRAVRLIKISENAVARDTRPPVYIVGSEVPVPGGATTGEDAVSVTGPEDFINTVEAFRIEFERQGMANVWERVVGVVVQPGVEFGDSKIYEYDREKARGLTSCLSRYEGVIFEGHSTDYQTTECLRRMVEDGIAILKVGPALTFAQRECIFALCRIENELIPNQCSNFTGVLEEAMLSRPEYWQRYYAGNDRELAFKRKYSFADRCRYYLSDVKVKAAYDALCCNLTQDDIPLSLLSQHLPIQYSKVRTGKLACSPEELIKDYIKHTCIRLYTDALE